MPIPEKHRKRGYIRTVLFGTFKIIVFVATSDIIIKINYEYFLI